MNRKVIWIVVVALIVIIVLVVNRSGSRSDIQPVKIGGLFNLTGYGAFAGESSRDGFTMAFEDSKISSATSIIEDAQSDLKAAVSGATKLSNIDKVIAVVGPEWTEFGEVVSPIAFSYKIPFISPWIVAEAPFVKAPYFLSAFPSARPVHTVLANYLANHNLKKIALIYSNNAWSQNTIQLFTEELAENPSLTVVSEDALDQTTKDFRTTISKIKAVKPDVIYAAIAEDDGHGAFIFQARQLGITQIIASDPSRAGSPVMKQKYPTLMYDQLFAELAPSTRQIEFEAKYEKRFSKKPEAPSAATSYDMATIILNAVKSGARTSDDIVSYLNSMPSHEGYSGTIAFDKDGKLPPRTAIVKKYNKLGVAEIVN